VQLEIPPSSSNNMNKTQSLKEQELNTILTVLHEMNGNVAKAAKKLGIHRSTIYKKLGRKTLY
jgi:transcriptional regulator of acetoin/glycerol metabolism